MPFFAQIVNGIVTQVIIVASSDCANGVLPNADVVGSTFLSNLGIAGTWKFSEETDGKQRFNTAGISFVYDTVRDAFIAPKPYASWALNEATCKWDAPVSMPTTGRWLWDEATLSWVAL